MAQNPLLGKRISLISKKDIRYEGLLYSINEQNATVALQNVRSYGTEGREREVSTENNAADKFVPPNDAIHPYLLFRGQDIKDLHVHENQSDTIVTSAEAAAGNTTTATNTATGLASPSTTAASNATKFDTVPTSTESAPEPTPQSSEPQAIVSTGTTTATVTKDNAPPKTSSTRSSATPGSGRGGGRGGGRSSTNNHSESRGRSNNNYNNRSGPNNNNHNIRTAAATEGTGASLLARKERGTNVTNDPTSTTEDFDFEQAATAAGISMNDSNQDIDNGVDIANDQSNGSGDKQTENAAKIAYSKDDFFDSISCDAIDKQSGVDHRIRGHQERKLNTETFGAVALNSNNNNRYNSRSRGGGRGGNSGGGRYTNGRSGGGGGRGRGSFHNNAENTSEGNTNDNNTKTNNNNSTRGGYRGGGRSSSGGRSNYRGGRNSGQRDSSGRNTNNANHQQRPTVSTASVSTTAP